MGRHERARTSKTAVKRTLKHARSQESLVVGIEALGLHDAASDDDDLEAVAASLSNVVVAASLSNVGGMDTTHHGTPLVPPAPPQRPTTLEDEFLAHGVRTLEGDWAAPRRAGCRVVGLARLEAFNISVTAVAFLDPRDGAFTCVVGPAGPALDALLHDMSVVKAHHGVLMGRNCVNVTTLSPPRPPPPMDLGLAPPVRQGLADLYGFAYAARPVNASHVDHDAVQRSVPGIYLRKIVRARAFGTLMTHAALSAMVTLGDTRIDALVTVAAARRHRRQRKRAQDAVTMASKGNCSAASFFRRFVALRRAALVPPPAAAPLCRGPSGAANVFRGPPPPVRAVPPLDLARVQAAVLGVPPATPPPSQRPPDAPRSAPELPARRRGRPGPDSSTDSMFLTWGDDFSPPQSTR